MTRILRNRRFIGEILGQERWHPRAHDPIVDKDLFEAAQAVSAKRVTKAGAAASNSDFILTGTISCARCGGAYVGTRGTGRGKSHRYYSCVTARRCGAKQCSGPSPPADELEKLVIDAILETYDDHGLFERAVQEYVSRRESREAPLLAQLTAQRKAIATKQRVRDKYQDDYERGALTAERFEERAAELDQELTSLRAHEVDLELSLSAEAPDVPGQYELEELHAFLRTRLHSGNTEHRKALCSVLIKSLVVHDRDDIAPTFKLLPPTAAADAAAGGGTGAARTAPTARSRRVAAATAGPSETGGVVLGFAPNAVRFAHGDAGLGGA